MKLKLIYCGSCDWMHPEAMTHQMGYATECPKCQSHNSKWVAGEEEEVKDFVINQLGREWPLPEKT